MGVPSEEGLPKIYKFVYFLAPKQESAQLRMRTKTTTREQTWNRAHNYPLKMFCWHLGQLTPVFREIYETVKGMECDRAIRRGVEVTDNPHAIYAINVFLDSCNYSECKQ